MTGPASPAGGPTLADRSARALAHPIVQVLAIFALSRAVTLLILIVTREVPLAEPIGGSLTDLLCRWDCSWYLRLVNGGYTIDTPPDTVSPDATGYAFFPLYPMLVATVSGLTQLSPTSAGLAVSNASFATALIYIYYYARDLGFSHRAGIVAVSLLCFGPPTVVFSSVFSESLFVLLLAAAVFHLRRDQFLASGVAAALLSATRPNGIAFVVFALVWVLRRHGLGAFLRPWSRPAALIPVVMAPLGLFAFWAFSFLSTGDAFAHVSANVHGWGWGTTGPIEMLTMLTSLDSSDLLLIGISGLTLAVSLLLLRYGLWEEFALSIATLAIIWTGGLAPWSMPRFALALFPLSVVVARAVDARPGVATALVATAATLNGFVLTVGWAMGAFVV